MRKVYKITKYSIFVEISTNTPSATSTLSRSAAALHVLSVRTDDTASAWILSVVAFSSCARTACAHAPK